MSLFYRFGSDELRLVRGSGPFLNIMPQSWRCPQPQALTLLVGSPAQLYRTALAGGCSAFLVDSSALEESGLGEGES